MVNVVKSTDTVNLNPAGDTSNKKRQNKRVKEKNLEEKQNVTPKKRPARGRFPRRFLHRTAVFLDNAVLSLIHKQRLGMKVLYIVSFLIECMILQSKLLLTGVFKTGSISDTW